MRLQLGNFMASRGGLQWRLLYSIVLIFSNLAAMKMTVPSILSARSGPLISPRRMPLISPRNIQPVSEVQQRLEKFLGSKKEWPLKIDLEIVQLSQSSLATSTLATDGLKSDGAYQFKILTLLKESKEADITVKEELSEILGPYETGVKQLPLDNIDYFKISCVVNYYNKVVNYYGIDPTSPLIAWLNELNVTAPLEPIQQLCACITNKLEETAVSDKEHSPRSSHSATASESHSRALTPAPAASSQSSSMTLSLAGSPMLISTQKRDENITREAPAAPPPVDQDPALQSVLPAQHTVMPAALPPVSPDQALQSAPPPRAVVAAPPPRIDQNPVSHPVAPAVAPELVVTRAAPPVVTTSVQKSAEIQLTQPNRSSGISQVLVFAAGILAGYIIAKGIEYRKNNETARS